VKDEERQQAAQPTALDRHLGATVVDDDERPEHPELHDAGAYR
jgi:hypothetical protein